MHRIVRAVLLAMSLAIGGQVASVMAHSGGLDAQGCHTNRKTGDYHCHRAAAASNAVQPRPRLEAAPPRPSSTALTDDEIAALLIRESIARYPGNCPCPYNSASNGSRCGGRSAYSRGGGYAPLCYRDDVTPAQIQAYRQRR